MIEVYALACVGFSAVLKILQRILMQQNLSHHAVLIFYNIAGGILLLPFIDFGSIASLSYYSLGLLCLASALWLMCDFLHLSALKHIDATQSEVFGTLRIVLTVVVGVIVFRDALSLPAILGILLIVGAMLGSTDLKSIEFNRGASLVVLATVFGTMALSVDKILLETVDSATVVLFAFFIPGAILVLRRPAEAKLIWAGLKQARIIFAILPVLGVIRYYTMVSAYQLGQLTTVTMILQATVFVVFLLEIFFLQQRKMDLKKGASSFLCAVGAGLVAMA